MQCENIVGQRHQHLHVVLDDHERHTFSLESLDQPDESRECALIDAAGNLVHEQQARARGHGAGELQAFALTGAERLAMMLAHFQQADEFQRFQGKSARGGETRRVLHDAHHDVLFHRHVGKGLEFLEGAADAQTVDMIRAQPPQAFAGETHLAGIR